jgi:hypothetical protein
VRNVLFAFLFSLSAVALAFLPSAASARSTSSSSNANSTAGALIEDAAAKLGLTGDQLAQALREARHELGVHAGVHLNRQQALTDAAKPLGLSDGKSMRQQLRGTTLTAIAQQRGIDPTTVANVIKADLNAQVDTEVSAGKLNANRAPTLKQRLATRVDALMTHQFKAASGSQG